MSGEVGMNVWWIGFLTGLTVVPCLFLVGLGVWVVLMKGAR